MFDPSKTGHCGNCHKWFEVKEPEKPNLFCCLNCEKEFLKKLEKELEQDE